MAVKEKQKQNKLRKIETVPPTKTKKPRTTKTTAAPKPDIVTQCRK
jgi:hypothetical protein